MMLYDETAVVLAYVEASPPYFNASFERFRKQRLSALEKAYGLRITNDGVANDRAAIAALFFSTAHTIARFENPRAGMLEDSLLNRQLLNVDPDRQLLELERAAATSLVECRQAYMTFITALFRCVWGPITTPLDSKGLRDKTGFDDFWEPHWLDDA